MTIPIADVYEGLSVSYISGRFGREGNSVIRITFVSLGTTTKRSIIFDVKNTKFVNTIEKTPNFSCIVWTICKSSGRLIEIMKSQRC